MNTVRRLELWQLAVDQACGQAVSTEDVCAVMISEVAVDGAAVTMTSSAGVRETVYASDPVAADLAELALTLGEGPSIDAGIGGGPALVADLATVDSSTRWPVYAPAAVAIGARATFALPLQVGGIRVGVVDLHRSEPGPLRGDQIGDSLMLADTMCALLIDSAAPASVHDRRTPERVALQHPEVHQATGMIIAQLGVTAAVALLRLRAYAYSHDLRLRDVARDVVTRRLRFNHSGESAD